MVAIIVDSASKGLAFAPLASAAWTVQSAFAPAAAQGRVCVCPTITVPAITGIRALIARNAIVKRIARVAANVLMEHARV